MFQDLGKEDSRLKGIIVIQGVGLSSNIYVINDDEITLVDTGVGDEYNRLDLELERLHLPAHRVANVILTHAHPDHFGGLLAIQSLSSLRILVHGLDEPALEDLDLNTMQVTNGETITTTNHKLKVIHTPGHTAGSICLFDEDNRILFSGDTVFPNGSFGRTDLPTGDSSALVDSLKRLTTLQVESLLAGHEDPLIQDGSSHVKLSYNMAKTCFER